uniref:Histidine decarboxylase n=1 Tax=Glossina austeni TaxID=7395 RepID=A0A1A9VD09_GLOAU
MDFAEYRQRGKEMVDYIADYLENIRERRVYPDVKPGYMQTLLPDSAPVEGESWDDIFNDVERVVMPGVTHWQSPHMHAYFPALNSFPSLLGDMLADAINCLGFTWASSPACTELEIIVMNWLGKMIGLPDDFLNLNNTSRGGGVVQTTASEATLVSLLAGRTKAIRRFHEKYTGYQDAEINARLVAYCSDQAHSSICATLGTTGSCSFDNLEEVGIVSSEFDLWLHVDAAYAGSAFICPEFRTWLKGIERADSFAFNPSKWLMIHFDATAMIKDVTTVHRTFNVEPLYLQHENSGVAVDFMHWQIPLSRRFRALKIWFVLRSFGIKGLQQHIREGVRLAQKFEALVAADHRFEIPAKRHLGLVVFRIKSDNEVTEHLLKRLNNRGNLHCIPSSLKGKYVIRFTVTSSRTTINDITRDWKEIKDVATTLLTEMKINISDRVYLKNTKEKSSAFGSSLLLSNSPLSPKIINGSFAAIFDTKEISTQTYAGVRITRQESPSMRRRVRGILMSGKQFSLDSHMDVVLQTFIDSSPKNSKEQEIASNKRENCDDIHEDEEAGEVKGTLAKDNAPVPSFLKIANQKYSPTKIHRRIATKSFMLPPIPSEENDTQTEIKGHLNGQEKECGNQELSLLYPGKRYLYSNNSSNNDVYFTENVLNSPSPKDEYPPLPSSSILSEPEKVYKKY